MHGRRFNIQQTINQKSSHSQYEHPSSQSYTRHRNVQKQRLGKNQCSSSQTFPIFLNNITSDRLNSRQMSQIFRKILFRATHRIKVRKQDDIENGTI